ncbi:SDR family NAD(P)-dependent oxidoreductase [Caballeronia novacaledonica]|uniref:SDR family NAD(P)-dependent oxidoreductase n=1 Tax=Caballeronia novacaledonica TaxID=1544861 RepID=A0ACB5R650_9BURK|nr:SDR family NAD(P)-dependent oxidoreductase [Caballeronia sp. LZ029]MDR5748871.1 SDR family NAD(P)-dependent oxidoreductase [Caballeronia sp. LZ029]GJH22553.1 SDR family NAD(P)-dependent oxidoreductase [Caballeronia novacaledonica]
MMKKQRVWFISGCSSGFGRGLARAALERGDCVAVTARNLDAVSDLVDKHAARARAIQLDVTDSSSVRRAVAQAIEAFGRIDVLVNNAGYALQGVFEDATDAQIRRVFETNVFGLMDLTRAVVSGMRTQGSGHIINLSSIVGRLSGPLLAYYSATKFAVEGLSEALAGELTDFGIRVTLIEPGPYATDFASRSLDPIASSDAYVKLTERANASYAGMIFDDPQAVVDAIVQVASLATPPLRLPVGTQALGMARDALRAQSTELERWAGLSTGGGYVV